MLIRVAIAATAAVVPALPLVAQDVLLELDSPGDTGLGFSLAVLSDVTGDGIREFAAVGIFDYLSQARVHDGASGAVIFSVPAAYSRYGLPIVAAGDLDADGAGDLLVKDQGGIALRSGRDGSLLLMIPPPGVSVATRAMTPVGDLDGDGVPDVLVGYGQSHISGGCDHYVFADIGPGLARVYSGATGATILALVGEDDRTAFGGLVAALGDVDRDGVPDFLVGSNWPIAAGSFGPALHRVVSGASGQVLYELPSTGSLIVRAISFGDVDGDGAPDFALAEPFLNRVTRYSGAHGIPLGTTTVATLTYNRNAFGESLALVLDASGDGVPDLLVGATHAPFPGCGFNLPSIGPGRVVVVSSASGAILSTFIGTELDSLFGRSAHSMGDVNGDGHDDTLVGIPGATTPVGLGRIRILSGNPAVARPTSYCASGDRDGFAPPATLGWSGSTSLAAADLVLDIESAQPMRFAVGFFAREPSFFPFGAGFRCLGEPAFRLPRPVALDATGGGSYRLDFAGPPSGMGPGTITVGSTWNFQFLFRQEPAELPNLTDALRVTFRH